MNIRILDPTYTDLAPNPTQGWQIAATMYRDKINTLFAKMFALKGHIHPAVRNSVDTYLHTVWTGISELTTSIDPYYAPESLREKFQSYIDNEERRLREGLEAVRYDIDAMDTLVLVTGPGRIEKVGETSRWPAAYAEWTPRMSFQCCISC